MMLTLRLCLGASVSVLVLVLGAGVFVLVIVSRVAVSLTTLSQTAFGPHTHCVAVRASKNVLLYKSTTGFPTNEIWSAHIIGIRANRFFRLWVLMVYNSLTEQNIFLHLI